jgi:tRNA(Ile)-lysidine synthase
VALTHLLYDTGFRFSLAHCNFGLRGEESEGDELFVRNLANTYGVACFHKYIHVKQIAMQEQISIQLAARNLRYQWFENLLKTYHYQYVLTAHHQNDVVETVLYNLVKGTGIAGLHGIKPKTNKLVRPLLFATKQEISEYIQLHSIPFREDSSNSSTKYSRNLLRNEVIPLLKQINPNLENTMQTTVERIAAVERIFEQEINSLRNKIQRIENQGDNEVVYLTISLLSKATEPMIKLYELLKPYHFNYMQVQQIMESLYKPAGRIFISSTHQLVKDRNELVITSIQTQELSPLFLEENTQYVTQQYFALHSKVIQKNADFELDKNAAIALLDKNSLKFPLIARLWQDGDKFQPLGMKGMKKISDFLNDKKIPLNLKSKIWVLCSGADIVWVIGHRIDERYKVTPQTTHIYRLALTSK